MRQLLGVTGILLLSLIVSTNGLAQSSNASAGGTVSDASSALIPGVTVTATNIGTGIVTTALTNESGIYQFATLQPGNYTIGAELTGFQTQIYNNVSLGIGQQIRLNFSLQVGSVAGAVDVTVAADTLIATTSSSIGAVLPEYKVDALPLANRNVLDLVGTTAATRGASFAGSPTGSTVYTRDGISVNSGRYDNGVFSDVNISPDMVEEVRIIVSSVDAANGRGSGAVQMRTRAGTNEYHGSLFLVNRNSVLDANTSANNFNGVAKNYLNRNNFGGRLAGPIVKNKTFFFFLYEGMRTVQKVPFVAPVLTQEARNGIYRYFPGAQSANANASGATVDIFGNPVRPAAATGGLQSISVFGKDPLRPGYDPTGAIQRILAGMPLPNDFTTGDGLNTAGHRWIRRDIGTEGNTGNGVNINRDQVNLRLDHQFNDAHRLTLVGTREKVWSDLALTFYPGGYSGEAWRRPVLYTVSFVSTLSPNLVNEFRGGYRKARKENMQAYDVPGESGEKARALIGFAGAMPYIIHPTLFTRYQINDDNGSIGERTRMTIIADDLTWTKGQHAFRWGGEVRRGRQWNWNSDEMIPHINLGPSSSTREYFQDVANQVGVPVTGIDTNNFPGLSNPDQQRARDLLTDLAGSVGGISEAFALQNARDLIFKDYTQGAYHRIRDFRTNELTGYFKDDWKMRSNFTLNYGVRWEWFGVTYEQNGLAGAPVDGSNGLFGLSGRSWDDWYKPGSTKGSLMLPTFVGKNSPNPELQLYPDDYNNFAPAVGFSWSLPWGGQDKTILRGGYGVSYQGWGTSGGGIRFALDSGVFPGANQYAVHSFNTYVNLAGVAPFLPIPERFPAGQLPVTPLTSRNEGVTTWSNDQVNPYIQNFNLELQREIASNLTFEVRYIGGKGTKLYSAVNINTPMTAENGILEAFRTTVAGNNAPLFDQLLKGLNLGSGVIDGVTVTGSASLRANTTTRTFLANNNPGALASYFNTTTNFTGEAGGILRANKFPENFIVTNPQFSSATIRGNDNNYTYHSLNLGATKRLSQGFTNQTTYTWSRNLGSGTGALGTVSVPDPRNRNLNGKILTAQHRTHQIRSNGTLDLPFGPNRLLLSNAPALVHRVVEGWKLGMIFNWESGAPLTLTGPFSPFLNGGTNYPNMVVEVPKGFGKVTPLDAPGQITYFPGWTFVNDPGRAGITTNQGLQGQSTLRAIQDESGKLILVNPGIGEIGNMGTGWLEGPSTLGFDANLAKSFTVGEGKNVQVRVDAINVLNKPIYGTPNLNINNTNFGKIALPTTGNRQFTFNLRYNF